MPIPTNRYRSAPCRGMLDEPLETHGERGRRPGSRRPAATGPSSRSPTAAAGTAGRDPGGGTRGTPPRRSCDVPRAPHRGSARRVSYRLGPHGAVQAPARAPARLSLVAHADHQPRPGGRVALPPLSAPTRPPGPGASHPGPVADIAGRSRASRARNAGNEPWSFLDGPITANNPMGVAPRVGTDLQGPVPALPRDAGPGPALPERLRLSGPVGSR